MTNEQIKTLLGNGYTPEHIANYGQCSMVQVRRVMASIAAEPSYYDLNKWNTTLLVLNVMERCASWHGLDIHNNAVADELYWICCDLQDWPEGEGFGSSDHYSYSQETKRRFHILPDPRCPYCGHHEKEGWTCVGCGAV